MNQSAIRVRRHRAEKYAAEVDAMRTVAGVSGGASLGPVLREELWDHRHRGAGLSLIAMANRFKAIAEDEGVPVEEIAERHQKQTVRPHRMTAGQRLHDLVAERADYIDEQYLVAMVEPMAQGTPNPAYLRVVRDTAGAEWLLVSNFDGSEPMSFPNDGPASLKAAAKECLDRVQAVNADPTAYDAWLIEQGATDTSTNTYTQAMTNSDFLAHTGDGGMHLI